MVLAMVLCAMMLVHPVVASDGVVDRPAVTSFVPSANVRDDGSVWVGACFMVGDTPVVATALGRAYLEGSAGLHEMRLFRRGDRSLLASATIDMAEGDPDAIGFKYAAIPKVTLEANTEYYVISQEHEHGDAWYDYTTEVACTDDLRVVSPVWTIDCITFSDADRTWTAQRSYGPVSVRFLDSWLLDDQSQKDQPGSTGDTADHSVGRLLVKLRGSSDSVRVDAIESLEEMGSSALAAVPDLILALGDVSLTVGWRASKALTEILGREDAVKAVAIPALQEAVHDEETPVRHKAIRALQRLAPDLLVSKMREVDGEMVVQPVESTEAFRNPGKGWVAYLFRPESNPTVSSNGADPPGYIDLVYTNYLTWAMFEPEEGEYRWDIIDRIVDHWGGPPYNKRIGLGIGLTYPTSISGTYHVPEWLVDTPGMEGHIYDAGVLANGNDGELKYEPFYWNAVFLDKWERFVNALSERYLSTQSWKDHIEFIDISTYGMWGEWHSKVAKWPDAETQKATLMRLVDIHHNAFPQDLESSPHLVQDVVAYSSLGAAGRRLENHAVTYSVLDEGSWMRRRAIGWPEALASDEEEFILDHWRDRRFIGEWGLMHVNPEDVLQAVQHGLSLHVSYLGWGIAKGPFHAVKDPETGETLQEYVQKQTGYRLVLREARYPSAVAAGAGFVLTQKWRQIGVAKLYEQYPLRAYLVGDSGDYALEADTSFDPTSWVSSGGDYEVKSHFMIPVDMPAGEYELRIAMVDPETLEPAINLAIQGKDVDDVNAYGRYGLGPITIVRH